MGSIENRAYYREDVPPGTLSIWLTVDGQTSPAVGQVVDISLGGTGITVGKDVAKLLTVGMQLTVQVTSRKVSGVQVRTPVRVAHITPSVGGATAVGLEFLKPAALVRALPPELAVWLNRRKVFRVTPAKNETVTVTMPLTDGPGALPVKGTLLDICTLGLGVLVDAAGEKRCGGGAIPFEFKLAGEPIAIAGFVCSRSPYEGKIRLGCSFDTASAKGWTSIEQTIEQYVTRRRGDSPL